MTAVAAAPFSDPAWIFEPKLDGIRCLVFRHGDQVRLWSRNRRRLNDRFPEIAAEVAARTISSVVLDGELVAIDHGRPSFGALQRGAPAAPVLLYVFDVLHLDGCSTRDLPLLERKTLLAGALDVGDHIGLLPHRVGDGAGLFAEMCARGWEGVMAKRAESSYTSGRSANWRKIKCSARQELVIGGYTDPKGSRQGFGALLVGHHDDAGRLHYAGKVGSGFDQRLLVELRGRLQAIERAISPFTAGTDPPADSHWVDPVLVGEVAFTEWTDDGLLRHPRFVGLRSDKPAIEVRRDPSPR